jgi:hypothetical protein
VLFWQLPGIIENPIQDNWCPGQQGSNWTPQNTREKFCCVRYFAWYLDAHGDIFNGGNLGRISKPY